VANVLFLCTGNSARSILGEVLMNELSGGRFHAFSAGSHPTGQVNPGTIAKLASEGHTIEGLSSKSWDEFAGADAPPLEVVITVCDAAAGESCPLWNGSPVQLHWSIPDPAAVADPEQKRAAFDQAYRLMRTHVERFLADTAP